jgi:hypothetical protein
MTNKNDIKHKIEQAALAEFKTVLAGGEEVQDVYKILTIYDGKPLLLTGTLNRITQDGYCMAVYNPEYSILERLDGHVAYAGNLLHKIVSNKCDLMLRIWIALGKKDYVSTFKEYSAQKPQTARFVV